MKNISRMLMMGVFVAIFMAVIVSLPYAESPIELKEPIKPIDSEKIRNPREERIGVNFFTFTK